MTEFHRDFKYLGTVIVGVLIIGPSFYLALFAGTIHKLGSVKLRFSWSLSEKSQTDKKIITKPWATVTC